MHVHLDHLQIADADDAVADAHQVFAQLVDVGKGCALFQVDDEELGAIGKLDLAQVHIDDIRVIAEVRLAARVARSLGLHFGDDLLAHDRGEKAAHDGHKSHAARVHDARLLQYGQKFGGLRERPVPFLDDGGKEGLKVLILARDLDGVLTHHANDGEDGALLGDGDGAVCDLGARLQSLGERPGVHFGLAVVQDGTDPAEDLREDDARIAARTAQSALGDVIAHVGEAVGGSGEFLDRRLHRERHVGAGIAVGHGEDVERVHLCPIIFQHLRADKDHLTECGAIDRFLHET